MMGIGELVIMGAVGISLALMLIVSSNNNRRLRQKDEDNGDEYKMVRRRIENRFKRRGEFAFHVVLFLFANLAFWFLIPMPKTASLWLSGAWGLVLVAHFVKLLFDEAQERAIDREFDRIRERDTAYDKPKRHHLALSEDGELGEMNDDLVKRSLK